MSDGAAAPSGNQGQPTTGNSNQDSSVESSHASGNRKVQRPREEGVLEDKSSRDASKDVAERSDDKPKSGGQSQKVPSGQEAPAPKRADADSSGEEDEQLPITAEFLETLDEGAREKLLQTKWKQKVNGKEREVTLDRILRDAQKASAADEKFQSSAALEKKMQSIEWALQNDPAKVFKLAGFSEEQIDQIATQRLSAKINREMMSEEEREAHDMRQQLETYKKKETESEEKRKKEFQDQMRDQNRNKWSKMIAEGMAKYNMPKSEYAVERTAKYLIALKERGYHDADVGDVVEHVKNDYVKEIRHVVGGMDMDQIIETFGSDLMDKIRKHELQKVTGPEDEQFKKPPTGKPLKREPKKRGMNSDEWRAELERRVR